MDQNETGRQLGWLVSVLSFALLIMTVRARQSQLGGRESNSLLQLQRVADVYSEGPLQVDVFNVYTRTGLSSSHGDLTGRRFGLSYDDVELGANRPPLPLLVASPKDGGTYPVILFQHGFSLRNAFYGQLLKHVASHGFVAVAPQMYQYFTGSDTTDEICSAANLLDWMATGLSESLSKRVGASVNPDLTKVALVGHSRGGKVVFGLAKNVCKSSVEFSAIVGLDPVDGTSPTEQSLPHILQFSPHALKLTIPTLIVGSGLGPMSKNWFMGPCAPEGVSQAEFFYESDAPAYHFVVPEYGHMDILNDNLAGFQGLVAGNMCKNGPSREPMRRFTSGIVVAFLKAFLMQDTSQLSDAISDVSRAPVKIEKPEIYLKF